MSAIKGLVVAAVAAVGLGAAAEVAAQDKHGWRGGAHREGHGGHHRHGHGHWGIHIGVPLLWGGYWADPWYYGPPRVVYREVIREPEVVETVREVPAPATTEVPRGEGAPGRGPLYMNYCESAKAYFPKVTQCPEGWKFIAPNQ